MPHKNSNAPITGQVKDSAPGGMNRPSVICMSVVASAESFQTWSRLRRARPRGEENRRKA